MADKNIVHIIGTGTIGEPLIGLFQDKKKELGIDEVTFHKRTPLFTDRSKVTNLLRRGAQLATDKDRRDQFKEMGMEATFEAEEAIQRASVVIDCTPKGVGHANKAQYYEKHADTTKGFIAQGSEAGFGVPYCRGINDEVLDTSKEKFVQVVSCNSHNLAVLVKSIGLENGARSDSNVERGNFVCIRRANDISQDDSFVPSPQAGEHKDARFGTHHAEDVHRLYKTLGLELDLFSTAMKVPTQYMHSVVFNFRLKNATDHEKVLANLAENPYVAFSHKMTANSVFSFGRDHGYYGRILNQAVFPQKSLHVSKDGKEVWGHCFTPQDGNSLLSSVAATLRFLDPQSVDEKLRIFEPYLFKEV
jgi:glyceraldehyde-3-phosphate dehydrogenase type II